MGNVGPSVNLSAIRESIVYGNPIGTDYTIDGVPLRAANTYSADDPVACMLSGGIDSSLVAATLFKEGRDVEAFTLTWGNDDDEISYATEVASILDIDIHEVHCELADYVKYYSDIAEYGPHARLGYYPVLKAARSAGFNTVYSGEGGDETFMGYTQRYRRIMHYMRWRSVRHLMRVPSILPGKWGRYFYLMTKNTWPEFCAARRARCYDAEMPDRFEQYYDSDWVVASLKYDYASLMHHVDTCCRIAEGLGISLIMPIMGRSFVPENRHDYWDGRSPYGKYPLVDELRGISHRIVDVATRTKHGFTSPPMENMWAAGLRSIVIDTLKDSPLMRLASPVVPPSLVSAINNGHAVDDPQRCALTEAYTIHKYLSSRGDLYA